MDAFTQSLLQYHGNGKHKQNWNYLNEIFQFNILLVEEAALQKNEETGVTVLLSYAHEISNSFRASLIVTLMLMYQMENLNEESYDVFISEVSNFFDYITPQEAECASEELAKLAHTVTRLSCDNQRPARVIPSLSRLSSTVSPRPSCLTAIHADILQASIAGKMYSFAHDFISNTVILEINPKKCYLEPVDFLKYFYYSGIVYIAVKDFKSALECFDQVLSFPLDALSAVCIDAYKKATLVSLIHAGKAYAAPSDVSRNVKSMCSSKAQGGSSEFSVTLEPYKHIEKLFLANDLSATVFDEESISSILSEDSNTGLAKQALNALYTHRIRKISKTYMSISLTKLAVLVGGDFTPEQIETKLITMNKQDLIFAKINNSTGIVVFHDLSMKFKDSMELVQRMQGQLSDAGILANKLRMMQYEVLSSETFLKKSVAAAVVKGEGSGGASVALGDDDSDMLDLIDNYE